jgi:hypothetical protein
VVVRCLDDVAATTQSIFDCFVMMMLLILQYSHLPVFLGNLSNRKRVFANIHY